MKIQNHLRRHHVLPRSEQCLKKKWSQIAPGRTSTPILRCHSVMESTSIMKPFSDVTGCGMVISDATNSRRSTYSRHIKASFVIPAVRRSRSVSLTAPSPTPPPPQPTPRLVPGQGHRSVSLINQPTRPAANPAGRPHLGS